MYVLLCANLLTASTISIPRENCSHKAPCIEYHAFMASVKSIFNFFLHKANFFKHFATLVIEVIILLLIFLIAFFIGASLASFAGCVAWRFANNVPQTIPRSFCENCRHALCFWQLIPVVGYLLQGGRCAFCKHKIPGHETLIEIVFGLFCGKIFFASSRFPQPAHSVSFSLAAFFGLDGRLEVLRAGCFALWRRSSASFMPYRCSCAKKRHRLVFFPVALLFDETI